MNQSPPTDAHASNLIDARVVIFAIGSRAGEAHRVSAACEMVKQMPIEKLAPVIGIETQDGKGQRRLDFGDA
ncbi:MAG: hypothetical protein WBX20_06110, partial [Terrimicrobiaceae bacterium]